MSDSPNQARRAMMGLLAKAPAERLASCLASLGTEPPTDWLRPPQSGTVMIRARIGGTGAPFNFGEMTVTRCVLRLANGTIGHAHVQGRDKDHARRAALIDALWQDDPARIDDAVLTPLRAEALAAQRIRAAKAAATRVEFFTLVRGEDA